MLVRTSFLCIPGKCIQQHLPFSRQHSVVARVLEYLRQSSNPEVQVAFITWSALENLGILCHVLDQLTQASDVVIGAGQKH